MVEIEDPQGNWVQVPSTNTPLGPDHYEIQIPSPPLWVRHMKSLDGVSVRLGGRTAVQVVGTSAASGDIGLVSIVVEAVF